MKAIKITYKGQTNTRPARYIAQTEHQKITMSVYAVEAIRLDTNTQHMDYPQVIAMELCRIHDWPTRLHVGQFGPCEWFACMHQDELTIIN